MRLGYAHRCERLENCRSFRRQKASCSSSKQREGAHCPRLQRSLSLHAHRQEARTAAQRARPGAVSRNAYRARGGRRCESLRRELSQRRTHRHRLQHARAPLLREGPRGERCPRRHPARRLSRCTTSRMPCALPIWSSVARNGSAGRNPCLMSPSGGLDLPAARASELAAREEQSIPLEPPRRAHALPRRRPLLH